MTLRDTDTEVAEEDSDQRRRDNTLAENYGIHDIGQGYLEARLREMGLVVGQLGDDDRHADTYKYSDGTPDVGIWPQGVHIEDRTIDNLVAGTEVKTKRYRDGAGHEWYPRLNQRHWNQYMSWGADNDVPVYLWFAVVDPETDVLHRKGVIPIKSQQQVVDFIPDVKGNDVVELSQDDERSLQWLCHELR